MPELALDHLNLGPDARPGLLQLVHDRAHRRVPVEQLALARSHDRMQLALMPWVSSRLLTPWWP